MKGLEKIIDLSHPMESDMTVFPGTKRPQFVSSSDFKQDGYRELFINIQSHTGTHIDAPAHLLEKGKAISDFSIHKFHGKACVLKNTAENPISIDQIRRMEKTINSVDFVLFNTDWDLHWNNEKYFQNFPIPDSSIFDYISGFNLKGIGIDAISVDPINSKELTNHHTLLSKEMIIIENLTNLSLISSEIFDFYCLPLPIKDGDGAPVRAIACLNN